MPKKQALAQSASGGLKIALVHDYLKEFGGAERVLEILSDIFPNAPIYTTLYLPKFFGPHRKRLQKKWQGRVHSSFFKFIPFASKLISPLRFLSPLAFKFFNFSKYDIIITSATGAYFPNSLNKKSAKLFCYCHTPPRYLYGLPTARDLKKYPIINFLAQIANHFLRLFDFHWAQNVDQFIANSNTVKQRIKKFYRKPAIIINPPIDLPSGVTPPWRSSDGKNLSLRAKRGNPAGISPFYLTGGRLARAKRYDIAIKACNKLKLPLKIFGRDFANFSQELKSMAGPTVEFLGEITQKEKKQLFRQAKALFFCSDNEDFGMLPLEAMAYGCPVIAYKSGGAEETVVDGKTGVFFHKLTSDSCITAIKKFQKLKFSSQTCRFHAQNFSQQKFTSKIKHLFF